MHRRLFIALPAALGMQTLAAQHGAFPARALKIIVPYMPGASPDVVARFLAEKLHPLLGQAVVVENRSGASGMIGAETAARSPADGHTLFISVTGIMAMNPHIFRNTIKYDALRDFKGVSLILDVPFVLTGAPGKPHTQSLAALVAAARQVPGVLNYASAGSGSHSHVITEWFCQLAGIRMKHIAFGSTSPTPDVMAGRIDVYFDPILTAWPLVKGGKVRALAISSARRAALLPDVPAVAETFAGFETYAFQGIFAPKNTPDAVVAHLQDALHQVLQMPDVRQKITDWGYLIIDGSAADLEARVRADLQLYGRLIRENQIHIN